MIVCHCHALNDRAILDEVAAACATATRCSSSAGRAATAAGAPPPSTSWSSVSRSSWTPPPPERARLGVVQGDPEDHRAAQRGPHGRADGDQPVLHPRQDVRQLGLRAARREDPRGVDRRDEGRRRHHRAHPLPRRRAQHAAARPRRAWARRCPSSSTSTSSSRRRRSSATTGASPSAVAKGDNGTRELLESILVGEEDHADWLETQLELIDQVGLENYLAQQIRD